MKLLFTIALLLVPFASPFHLPPVHGKCPPTTRRMSSPLSSNELIKQQLTQKQKQYEAARKSVTMASNTAALPTLESLKMLPYLCPETGLINPDCYPTSSAIRASVYGIFDASYGLQFIGMSRNIKLSLRMHLGRKPDATYGIVVYHVQKPSRTLLESIKEQWIEEVGTALDEDVAGWESALDVKAVMNEKDRQMMTDAENKVVKNSEGVLQISKFKSEGVMKKIARRFENEKVAILKKRGCNESLRFDSALKATGLLELYVEKQKVDKEVPKEKPKDNKK